MDFKELKESLFWGDQNKVVEFISKYLNEGVTVKSILDEGLISGMEIVGQKFRANEIFIPEVLIAANAMHAGMNLLEPYLAKGGFKKKGVVVIGTVKGDLHDIGKNIVAMMFKGAGFDVIDLGIDVSPERFVDAAGKGGVNVIAMSSLLTTSMPFMEETIAALKKTASYAKIKTMIGGAPVTQQYADKIGAHGYSRDASSAVDKAKELLGI